MKNIKTVGVVGAGTMGSALAQKFAQEGFNVILADREMKFVEKGLAGIRSMLNEGIERRVFSAEQVQQFLSNIKGTEYLPDLGACDLVVEAIFENFNAKRELFQTLSTIVPAECIVATNTSSFSVSELAEAIDRPERFIGLHFFYHAAKNRLVEIIPGKRTSANTVEAIKRFALQAGKDPISCSDVYGFAVNRFFVPWLNESARLLEEGVGTMEEIDAVCMKVFGIGMGPFALMNATGVPVAYHSEKTLEVFGKLYQVSEALKTQAESAKPWPLSKQLPDVSAEKEKAIRERMLGVVFFVCSQILDEKVCTAGDLNKGARIGLRWKKGPVELMKQYGQDETARIIVDIVRLYDMNLPASIGKDFWETEALRLEKDGSIAVITFDQPESLNALSEESMHELGAKFDVADNDPNIETIFLTGSGKAFVAGADIKFFVKNIRSNRIGDIETFTEFGQQVFDRIDRSKKKVVAILNGLTFGGGLELALCADVILALPKATMAFPETGIGIYPGLGGTQRSTRRIGKGLSKYLIHTGRMLTAADAEEIGLVDKVVEMDEMFEILSGAKDVPAPEAHTISGGWKHVSDFFEENSLSDILARHYADHALNKEEAEKISKTISIKAPIALRLADSLIEAGKGPASELEHLNEIFSTEDALLGLTSIGKRVAYSGK